MPTSWAWSMIAWALSGGVSGPKFMVPRQSRLTLRPVRPRCVYSMFEFSRAGPSSAQAAPGLRMRKYAFGRYTHDRGGLPPRDSPLTGHPLFRPVGGPLPFPGSGLRLGHVQGRVAVEEPGRLQPERHRVGGHHRPVLGPGNVVDAEHVPQHHVGAGGRPVLRGPGAQAVVLLALVAELPARPAFGRVVGRDPQRVPDDPGPLEYRRG